METIKNWIGLAALIIGLLVACITLWQKINELLKTEERKRIAWSIISSGFVEALWVAPIILYHVLTWSVALWTAVTSWVIFTAVFLARPKPVTRFEISRLILAAMMVVLIGIMGVLDLIGQQQGVLNQLIKFITTTEK